MRSPGPAIRQSDSWAEHSDSDGFIFLCLDVQNGANSTEGPKNSEASMCLPHPGLRLANTTRRGTLGQSAICDPVMLVLLLTLRIEASRVN